MSILCIIKTYKLLFFFHKHALSFEIMALTLTLKVTDSHVILQIFLNSIR